MIDHINRIILGDCLEVMKRLPDNCIDIVITSPPYNILNTSGGGFHAKGKWARAALSKGYDNYNDNIPHEAYVEWQREVLTECMRLIKPTGAIFYNHKWRCQNLLLQDRSDIVSGFPVRQIIIWWKKGAVSVNRAYFTPCYEVIYMIAKKDFKLQKGMVGCGDVWAVNTERNNDHPAPFPLAIPDRIIKSCDCEVVLDPFSGSGTTALAAKLNKKSYIGIELSEKYRNMSLKRLGVSE